MTNNPLISLGKKAREAANILAHANNMQKNIALAAIMEGLISSRESLLSANAKDIEEARKNGVSESLIDRLSLNESRIESIIESVRVIQSLPDPIDQLLNTTIRPNGLRIEKHTVPLGVIGIVFESRPNVAIDAAALCLKSGNACILRGGSDSWNSVQSIIQILQNGVDKAGLPRDSIQSLPSSDRTLVGALLKLENYVDVIIPRGGKSLISRVREESRIPVFSHLDGICHTYVDNYADEAKAVAVTLNAKMRRTSVCGSTECLILHRDIADTLGKIIITSLIKMGCEVRAPQELLHINSEIKLAQSSDYGFEFLAPIIAVSIVSSVEEAVNFINTHGSQHTDAIITENRADADYFLSHVSSAIALHNASTQFADGGEFGKGAEIGISTGKLHARGPVGLEELTSYQYRIYGNGQTRP